MSDNPYMDATSVEELRSMEKSLYEECFENGQMLEGCEEYYQMQMELFEDAFASLFPDDYDYHKRGRQGQP
ncbi:MAG: hypothetical protein ACYDBJ_12380 [Aggregatilineales bacterium]